MSRSAETVAAFRFGYGFARGGSATASAGVMLDGLLAPEAALPIEDGPSYAERAAMATEYRGRRRAQDGDATKLQRAIRQRTRQDGIALIRQRAWGPSPLFERLTAFWVDHFAVVPGNAVERFAAPAYEAEAIRRHLTGAFAELLIAAALHPAMQISLDQQASVGPNSANGMRTGKGLNENLARELIELHTLGVKAAYSQEDVTALARLLTGVTVDRKAWRFDYRPGRSEPGSHVVLGRRYGGGNRGLRGVEALLGDLAMHPDTGRHLATKLAVHFVGDPPPEGLVEHVASAWRRSDGWLADVYAALLEHPAAWQPTGDKARRPEEFAAAVLRAGGAGWLEPADERALVAALAEMGQPAFSPPGPDGWPEALSAWITPQALSVRLRVGARAGRRMADLDDLDPREFARKLLGDALRDDTAAAIAAAPERWQGFALAFSAPEFHRR
jgi:uncharacterized protein (DUF1800 family)